jgi:hypothetical protein
MSTEHDTPGQSGGGISTRTMEIVTALILLVIGGVVAFDSHRIGSGWASDGPQAGYFPFYIGLFICIASAATLIQAFFVKGDKRTKIFVEWGALRQVMAVLIPAIVFVLGIQLFGIYLAATAYIAVFMVWLGKYHWGKGVALGFGVSAAMFLMFEVWFQVPLFKGYFNPLGFLGY